MKYFKFKIIFQNSFSESFFFFYAFFTLRKIRMNYPRYRPLIEWHFLFTTAPLKALSENDIYVFVLEN